MGISKEQLAKIIQSKAGGLCTPEADRRLDGMGGRSNIREMYDPDPASFSDVSDPWGMPNASDAEYEPHPTNQKGDFVYSTSSAQKSNMPDAIKRSMLERRIDTSSLSNVSVTDQLGIKPQPKRQQITETRVATQQQAVIDYSLIKSIVKECVEEALNAKQQLNESAISQIHLKSGKIRLVDHQGNIYSAKLEKVGNVNEQ